MRSSTFIATVRIRVRWLYCLVDRVKPKYHQPYFPEKESDEQSVKNAIRVISDDHHCVEVSRLLPRLRPLTEQTTTTRYYIPHELKGEAIRLKKKVAVKSDHHVIGKIVTAPKSIKVTRANPQHFEGRTLHSISYPATDLGGWCGRLCSSERLSGSQFLGPPDLSFRRPGGVPGNSRWQPASIG